MQYVSNNMSTFILEGMILYACVCMYIAKVVSNSHVLLRLLNVFYNNDGMQYVSNSLVTLHD